MAPTLPQPRPGRSFAGRLAEGWRLVRTGRIRLAIAELERAARWDLTATERAEHASLRLTCDLATGDLTAAQTVADTLGRFLPGDDGNAALAHFGRGELAAAVGEHEVSLAHFEQVGRLSDDPGLALWRAGAAIAMVRTGRRAEAASLARQQLALAEESAEPGPLAVALRTCATADMTVDPFRALRRARGLAHAAGDLRLSAQVETDLANLLLLVPSADSVREAVVLLRGAEAYAATEHLWPLHGRVGRLLERADERPRPLQGEALAMLTPGEQRVARLAAQGLTNRQIADRLAVSIKGVEWHLSRVYRKLGIDSRSGLGQLLETAVHRPDAVIA